MVGNEFTPLLEPAGVHALERFRRGTMKRPAPCGQDALVRYLLGQRVLEDMDRVVGAAPLVDEVHPGELSQTRRQRAVAPPHFSQQAQRELPPQDRGGFEQLLVGLGQSVDACREHALDGGRDDIAPLVLGALAHGPRQLLEEERIALAPRQDERGHVVGRDPIAEGTAHDGRAVRR